MRQRKSSCRYISTNWVIITATIMSRCMILQVLLAMRLIQISNRQTISQTFMITKFLEPAPTFTNLHLQIRLRILYRVQALFIPLKQVTTSWSSKEESTSRSKLQQGSHSLRWCKAMQVTCFQYENQIKVFSKFKLIGKRTQSPYQVLFLTHMQLSTIVVTKTGAEQCKIFRVVRTRSRTSWVPLKQ